MKIYEDVELSADFIRMLRHTGDVFLEANAEQNTRRLDLIMINSAMLVALAALKHVNPDRDRANHYIANLMAHWDQLEVKELP